MASASYISSLLGRLHSGSDHQALQAARTLLDLSCDSDDHLAAIIAGGDIQALVQLISSSDASDDLLEAAALLLRKLTVDSPGNNATFAMAVGITGLVQHLRVSRSSDRVQTQVIAALANLIQNPELGVAATASGVIPLLVQHLRSGCSEDMQLAIAMSLGSIATCSSAGRAAIGAAGAIPLMVQLLRSSGSEEVQVAAAGALGCLSWDSPESSAAIAAAGARV
ncbi:hypothetical protein CHLNCDRAFT_141120 [Chlorella variabilis]|uniref:Armadillo repeat-containing domain-containing protein n=1 Tax=Chlorella variabilis TaxID=554065 RepID=E1ZS64_CHLVA|nr:hypothetical protein CHLNCDRAFT_141120 [Chlorella variabilis]EFN51359.1 hypothetical protein CHLNCDRAFT_141120 [Chlorella variabilis]|eukprot:XP_005843461.1 hypothetical protein CHLNCDRAFT_141120 [Chlorella variabilis]